jgi:hypothetical protein
MSATTSNNNVKLQVDVDHALGLTSMIFQLAHGEAIFASRYRTDLRRAKHRANDLELLTRLTGRCL